MQLLLPSEPALCITYARSPLYSYSNPYNLSPYCFSSLVVPLSLRRIVYNACYPHSESRRLHHLTARETAYPCPKSMPTTG